MKSKAIFLLVIFLLNTVVGFGCALGMETGHHHHPISHHHKTAPVSGVSFSTENSCCKTLINELATQSKLIPESDKLQVVLPVLWLPDYVYALLIPVTDLELHQHVDVNRRKRPPNEDIRIAIQSFQI